MSALLGSGLDYALHLEEAAQPPDLEDGLADDDADDKEVPPLDTAVGALGSVAVGALAHDNVRLLVLDLGQQVGHFARLSLEGVLGRVILRHVHYAVDVERHLLAGRAPVLVAEAVDELAVLVGGKGEVAVGGGLLQGLILARGVCDLQQVVGS